MVWVRQIIQIYGDKQYSNPALFPPLIESPALCLRILARWAESPACGPHLWTPQD